MRMTWLLHSPCSHIFPGCARHTTNVQTRTLGASGMRGLSNALHFYGNKQLELYAAKKAKRMTLRQLVCV
ncbi:hypothetical protein BC835DRAFT_1333973 [Cytidiella melzeri]|nr:hypothetical protein BC835DRAFT_1333973 [Cytidiella melzeri]